VSINLKPTNRFYREGIKHRFCGAPLDVVLYWRKQHNQYGYFKRLMYERRDSHFSSVERPGDYRPTGRWESPPYSVDKKVTAALDGRLQHFSCGALLRWEEAWIVSLWCTDFTLFQGRLDPFSYPKTEMWTHFNLTLDRRS
jgi:hypothetical protein